MPRKRRRLRRNRLGHALLAGALCGGSACIWARTPEPYLAMVPDCEGPQGRLSGLTIAGKTLLWPNGEIDMSRLRAALRGRRAVQIHGSANTPYRCIGGLIYSLQRLGVYKVDFMSQPPPAKTP